MMMMSEAEKVLRYYYCYYYYYCLTGLWVRLFLLELSELSDKRRK